MSALGGNRSIVHPSALQNGKRASRALVKAVGGQEEAAKIAGKSQPRLSSYGLPNTADFMPINDVQALEAVTHGHVGHPHVTRWLADEAGYLLVKKPEALPSDADWHDALAGIVKETGDVAQRILMMLPGGVTAAEVREGNIRAEIAEAMEKLACLDALCARAEEGDL